MGVVQLVSDGTQWWILSEETKTSAALYENDFTPSNYDDLIGVNFTENNTTINLSLPPAAELEGKRYEIKRNANGQLYENNSLRAVPASGENLDEHTNGVPYLMDKDWESLTIQSTGTMWLILGNYGH